MDKKIWLKAINTGIEKMNVAQKETYNLINNPKTIKRTFHIHEIERNIADTKIILEEMKEEMEK